jgi:hypothetical protein
MKLLFAAASLTFAAPTLAQYLMVPDRLGNRVLLLDGVTGDVVNADFIPDGRPTYVIESPRAAIQVGNQIWLSDEGSRAIHRFTAGLTPQYIATIPGPFSLIRGINVVGDHVYAVHSGTSNGAPGNVLLMYDFGGNQVNQVSLGTMNTYDVVPFQGGLLISSITGDNIERFTAGGDYVGVFHDSDGVTGIDLPNQMKVVSDGVWAAGFSDPSGVYKYDLAGVQTVYLPVSTTAVGVHPLPDGKMLVVQTLTTDGGIYRWDPSTGAYDLVIAGPSFQYIHTLNLASPPMCGSADFDCDGDTGTDADIEAFFTCLAGTCPVASCDSTADFDGDGDTGTDADIEAFFRVLSGGAC